MASQSTPASRFWSKVEFTDSCWLWTGHRHRQGYGTFWLGTETGYAHRWAYEFCIGPIPEGLQIDHLCHNEDESCLGGPTCLHRRCVRPDHLEPVTSGVNKLRGFAPPAKNARKTHCVQGHPYSGANLVRLQNGYRQCRACVTRARRKYNARQKVKA